MIDMHMEASLSYKQSFDRVMSVFEIELQALKLIFDHDACFIWQC